MSAVRQWTKYDAARAVDHLGAATIADVAKTLGCSYSPALQVLEGAYRAGLVDRERAGRRWVYRSKQSAGLR